MSENNICVCGRTSDGRPIIGGAFFMVDTMGVPLSFLMDESERQGTVISLLHFFACAIEHGWDDKQAFAKIREALEDRGRGKDSDFVENECLRVFMNVARSNPNMITAVEIATALRKLLERGVSAPVSA